jgi:putative transposase
MRQYHRSAHTVHELHYHFVFTTKYRKPVLRGDVGTRVRDLIREICRMHDVDILKGAVKGDHVHLFVSAPPHVAPSRLMQAVKGKTSHHLMMEYRSLSREFWGRHLWASGYFVCSSGNVTDKAVADYVASQGGEPQDDQEFTVG